MASTGLLIADELYRDLEQGLRAAKKDNQNLSQAIVELPFEHAKEMAFIFMGFICYFSLDRSAGHLKLEAATHNDYLNQAMASYDSDGTGFIFPLTATDNSIVQAVLKKEIISLTDWDNMRRPGVEEGVARLNQATSGIAYSLCAPVGDFGVLGFNLYQPKEALPAESEEFVRRYSELVADILSE